MNNTRLQTIQTKTSDMVSSGKEGFKSLMNTLTTKFGDIGMNMNMDNNLARYFLIGLTILLVFGILYYIQGQIQKKNTNTKTMIQGLENIPIQITNINPQDAQYKHSLRDYYIMSSYNSCCNGDFNNGYVSNDALKQVIKRGVRVLDFEVYSVDGKTVIAASENNNYYQKGTYNALAFEDVMKTVERNAYSASTCPNFNDPLFLHFRIKSTQPHVFKDMTNTLMSVFKQRRLGNRYNNESNGENIGNEPIQNFIGKVVFMCDRSNNAYTKSELEEIINITSGSHFLQQYKNYDIEYTHNYQDIINNNKKNMAITSQDYHLNDTTNMNASLHMKYGVQMICMNFQSVDENLVFYLDNFNKNGHAFLLKPQELRYQQKVIPLPKAQQASVSYAEKTIQKPYFKHTI